MADYRYSSAKDIVTRIGAHVPQKALALLQSVLNYLKLGRWMRERDFKTNPRRASRTAVWSSIIPEISHRNVLYLEFGVYRGESMNFWSKALRNPKSNLHGFDSFAGLPEKSGHWLQGQFDTSGVVPVINDPRVKFFKGWFNDELPKYIPPQHDILLINLDADIYSSTIFVLRQLRSYIKPGTFLYFDEFNSIDNELRAFDEYLNENKFRFRFICADKALSSVLFECTEAPCATERLQLA